MEYTILDCYTDEPSGLGVPPYLGTYPRYISAKLDNPTYLTIDDLRLYKKDDGVIPETKLSQKTRIDIYNLSKNHNNIKEILETTSKLIIITGVQAPGKYLSAIPGTLHELKRLLQDISCDKILTEPALFGSSLHGGKIAEKIDTSFFKTKSFNFKYDEIAELAPLGARLIGQIPDKRIVEIETGHGCPMRCSFCTEPVKNKVEYREKEDIIKEMKAFDRYGVRYFRLGKQSCFYSYPKPIELLKDIREQCKNIDVLHIDNVNPNFVSEETTKAIVQYCTSGNIAAFGVESFDMEVIKQNTLNASPERVYKAVKIINKYGRETGDNGLPKFLPGINIIFGLKGETKKTMEDNMLWLRRFLKEDLLLRRINIRQVAIFEGTKMAETGVKFLRKNKRYYWKWRNAIRQEIDSPMLAKVIPKGTILKDAYAEIYDGKTTFARQFGTYPLIVGIKGRLPLKRFYDVKITGHMLRSITGEVVNRYPVSEYRIDASSSGNNCPHSEK